LIQKETNVCLSIGFVLLNDNFLEDPSAVSWIQPNAITKDKYTPYGNYDQNGNISIVDYGPDNIDQLILNLN
jgi:hypothetical protein